MQITQFVLYIILCITCISPFADLQALGIQKIQGEELSPKNLGGFLTPRGHHGHRGKRGKHGEHGRKGKRGRHGKTGIGVTGATGPTGATGATGAAATHIYGAASRAATNVVVNPGNVIPFEVTGILNGVMYDNTATNFKFIITTPGVYRVAYVVNANVASPADILVALNLVGSGIIANTTREGTQEIVPASGTDRIPLAFSGNLSLNAGDQIQVINVGTFSIGLSLLNPGSAFTVIKVGDL